MLSSSSVTLAFLIAKLLKKDGREVTIGLYGINLIVLTSAKGFSVVVVGVTVDWRRLIIPAGTGRWLLGCEKDTGEKIIGVLLRFNRVYVMGDERVRTGGGVGKGEKFLLIKGLNELSVVVRMDDDNKMGTLSLFPSS